MRAPPPGFAQPKAEQPSQRNPDKGKLRQEASQAEPPMAPQLPKGQDRQASTSAPRLPQALSRQARISPPHLVLGTMVLMQRCLTESHLPPLCFKGTCWCAYPDKMRMP